MIEKSRNQKSISFDQKTAEKFNSDDPEIINDEPDEELIEFNKQMFAQKKVL